MVFDNKLRLVLKFIDCTSGEIEQMKFKPMDQENNLNVQAVNKTLSS